MLDKDSEHVVLHGARILSFLSLFSSQDGFFFWTGCQAKTPTLIQYLDSIQELSLLLIEAFKMLSLCLVVYGKCQNLCFQKKEKTPPHTHTLLLSHEMKMVTAIIFQWFTRVDETSTLLKQAFLLSEYWYDNIFFRNIRQFRAGISELRLTMVACEKFYNCIWEHKLGTRSVAKTHFYKTNLKEHWKNLTFAIVSEFSGWILQFNYILKHTIVSKIILQNFIIY